MKVSFTCPSCSSSYKVAEEKVPPRGARITCPRCATRFVVYRDGRPTPDPAGRIGGETPQPERDVAAIDFSEVGITWRVRHNGRVTHQFFDLATLQEALLDGQVERRDEISFDGRDWRMISSIPKLEDFFWEILQRARRGEVTPVRGSADEDESDAPTTLAGRTPPGAHRGRPPMSAQETPILGGREEEDSSSEDDGPQDDRGASVRPAAMPSWMPPPKQDIASSQEPTVTAGAEILASLRDPEPRATAGGRSGGASAGGASGWLPAAVVPGPDSRPLAQLLAWRPRSVLPFVALGFGTVVFAASAALVGLYSSGAFSRAEVPEPVLEAVAPATIAPPGPEEVEPAAEPEAREPRATEPSPRRSTARRPSPRPSAPVAAPPAETPAAEAPPAEVPPAGEPPPAPADAPAAPEAPSVAPAETVEAAPTEPVAAPAPSPSAGPDPGPG